MDKTISIECQNPPLPRGQIAIPGPQGWTWALPFCRLTSWARPMSKAWQRRWKPLASHVIRNVFKCQSPKKNTCFKMVSCVISQFLVCIYHIYLHNLVICSVYWLDCFTYIFDALQASAGRSSRILGSSVGMACCVSMVEPILQAHPWNLKEDILYMIFLGKDIS